MNVLEQKFPNCGLRPKSGFRLYFWWDTLCFEMYVHFNIIRYKVIDIILLDYTKKKGY